MKSFFGEEFDLISQASKNIITENLKGIDFGNLDSCEKLDLDDILSKICVSPPYFAFEEIYKIDNYLVSYIHPEQLLREEEGVISITEAGRHLAILGSCLFGNEEDKKFYYLANQAKMHKLSENSIDLKKDEFLTLIACKNEESINRCGSYGLILKDNIALYSLDVKYQKLSTKLFSRIFKKFAFQYEVSNHSPYKELDLVFESIEINENCLKCKIPPVGAINCSGHFYGYPMLPVAISAYILTNAAGILFKEINDKDSYIIKYLDLLVTKPSSPFEEKVLEILLDKELGVFKCSLCDLNNNEEVSVKLIIST